MRTTRQQPASVDGNGPAARPLPDRWDCLRQRFGGHVLVVAAHGSNATPWANRSVQRFVDAIRATGIFAETIPAWLQGTMSLADAGQRLNGRPTLVLPFMTARGYYTDTVFPRRLRENIGDGHSEIRFLAPLGEAAGLVALVADRMSALIPAVHPSARKPVVIIVGHGTRKNRNSCRSTVALTRALRQRFAWGNRETIQFAFIDQRPTLEQVATRTRDRDRWIIPLLMGLGPHVTEDLPRRLGLAALAPRDEPPPFPLSDTHDRKLGRTTTVDLPVGCYEPWPEMFLEDLARATSAEESTGARRPDRTTGAACPTRKTRIAGSNSTSAAAATRPLDSPSTTILTRQTAGSPIRRIQRT